MALSKLKTVLTENLLITKGKTSLRTKNINTGIIFTAYLTLIFIKLCKCSFKVRTLCTKYFKSHFNKSFTVNLQLYKTCI